MKNAEVSMVVTLVHGTWARDATWTQPGSKLRDTLNASVLNCLIETFSWSGSNSASQRFAAAEVLAKDLEARFVAFPNAEHVVIGHSHGGYVALKALELAGLSDKFYAICLSTPFVYAIPRVLGGMGVNEVFGKFILIMLFDYLLMYVVLNRPIGMIPLGMFLTIVWLAAEGAIKSKAERTVSNALLPAIASQRLLLLRSTADEATFAISTSQFISWMIAAVYRSYIDFVDLISKVLSVALLVPFDLIGKLKTGFMVRCWIAACATWTIVLVSGKYGMFYRGTITLLLVFTPVFYVLIVLAMIGISLVISIGIPSLAATIVVPLTGLLALLSLPALGWDLSLCSSRYELTVEITPPGEWKIRQLTPTSEGLRHSSTYESHEALEHICAWLLEKQLSHSRCFYPDCQNCNELDAPAAQGSSGREPQGGSS